MQPAAQAGWGPDDPVAFGRGEIMSALEAKRLDGLASFITAEAVKRGDPERFTITFRDGRAHIVGSDIVGTMYGEMEMAERIRRVGTRAAMFGPPIERKPFLRDRGWNEFLTLPYSVEKHDSDYDPAALIDPNRWWFQNDDFWRTLFDEMARARLNWLDLHGKGDSRAARAGVIGLFCRDQVQR